MREAGFYHCNLFSVVGSSKLPRDNTKQRGKHGHDLNGSGLRLTPAIPSLTCRDLGFAVHYWARAHLQSVLID